MPGAGALALRGGRTASAGGVVGSSPLRPVSGVSEDVVTSREPTGHRAAPRSWQAQFVTEPGNADEGLDGSVVAFHERVYAPWPAWLVSIVLTGSVAIAYGYPLGARVGIVTFVVGQGLATWWLIATAPLVVVDDLVFRAGRARLPLRYVSRIAPLDASQTREARGPLADPRAYLCTRGWTSRSVLVEVDDPDDPHPYWLISTRRGLELAPVLAAARDSAKA